MATKKNYQALTIPKVTWDKERLSSVYGEFSAQPLEPGFGITLGNALRRILLGGIEGSAVTSIVIKGANNEFAVIPGIVEDTMAISLNCKGIIIRNKTGQPGKMKLVVKGNATATAADIVADDHLEILNPEHVIARVAQDGTLAIEFFVESGRGYQAAQWPIGVALQENGRIFLDAMFSPVRKVTFDVDKTRVGRNIDYDKLLMAIVTDGTQTPVEVLHYAVSVLRTQLEHFLVTPEIPFNDISERVVPEVVHTQREEAELNVNGIPVDLLLKPIDVLEFSVRAHNCLLNAGIKRVIDLVHLSEDEVLKIKNFGSKSYDEVKESLKSFGLSFGMNIEESDIKNLSKEN